MIAHTYLLKINIKLVLLWWRHCMDIYSASLALFDEHPTVTCIKFDGIFVVSLDKLLNKSSAEGEVRRPTLYSNYNELRLRL